MRYYSINDRVIQLTAKQSQTEHAQVEQNLLNSITFVKLAENGVIDDTTATEHIQVFSEWEPSIAYTAGEIRRYNDLLYKCLQAHSSQVDWAPDVTPALWKKIGDPMDEYPLWSQPIGATDAYQTGDKVTFDNTHWISTVDNNVWAPGVYGWDEI